MPIVSWIEDEADKLKAPRELLPRLDGIDKVVIYTDATSAVRDLDRIRADEGPVVLDLSIPPGAESLPLISAQLPTRLGPPEVGLHLLHILRERLGSRQGLFIISGNLTLEIEEHILKYKLVPPHAMFTKPLTPKKIEQLLKLVGEAIPSGKRGET